MTEWQALEALADGRQLWRLPTALAGQFSPGQSLQIADQRLPIVRAEPEALVVVAAQPIDGTGELIGHALAISAPQSLLLVSHDDGLFAVLAWLFRHRRQVPASALRVLAAFSGPLPFRPQPSRYLTPKLPAHVTAALPLLDDWQIVSRIAHPDGLPGCYDEDIEHLVRAWCEPSDRIMIVR